jgi:hypothetical protein
LIPDSFTPFRVTDPKCSRGCWTCTHFRGNTEENSMTRRLLIAALLPVLLNGCGTAEVVQTSPTTYSVSAQFGSLNGSWDRAKSEATAKATQFCEARGQQVALLGEQRSGVYGWSPQKSTIAFACTQNTGGMIDEANAQCKADVSIAELAPLRDKIELYREAMETPPPFGIIANDTFPTDADRTLIAKWATLRDECIKRIDKVLAGASVGTQMQIAFQQQDQSFGRQAAGRVSELIVALYQQKLTYGEFAKKRYEITRDAAAAERQFRESKLIADQDRQMQAQHLAQQQFQNNLAAWSAYTQAVIARQPQTVHLDGSVRLQSNCISQRIGNTVTTNCN